MLAYPLTISLIIAFSLIPSVSVAEQFIASAKVQITDSIEITQNAGLNFGQIEARNGVCSMSSGGVLDGSQGQTCSGQSSPGSFTISATTGRAVNFSVSANGAVNGVTLQPQVDGSAMRVAESNTITLEVIGSLQLENATPGALSISYTLTANYN